MPPAATTIGVLTKADLKALTDSARKEKQIQWLNERGIRFLPSQAGYPKVLQAEIERVMIGGHRTEKQQPNFGAISGEK